MAKRVSPDNLKCFQCGYDLRGHTKYPVKCPECAFVNRLRDLRRGYIEKPRHELAEGAVFRGILCSFFMVIVPIVGFPGSCYTWGLVVPAGLLVWARYAWKYTEFIDPQPPDWRLFIRRHLIWWSVFGAFWAMRVLAEYLLEPLGRRLM